MTGLRRFRLFAFQFFWYNLRRKEVFAMTDIEALKESVSEKLYAQEPLAQAIFVISEQLRPCCPSSNTKSL